MKNIIIPEFIDEDALVNLQKLHNVTLDPTLVDKHTELCELIGNADAVIVRNRTQMRGELLAKAKNLKAIGRLGVGLDNIDLEECAKRGIKVYPATGGNDISVAEYVLTAMLTLLRPAYSSFDAMIAGKFPRNALMGYEISGKIIGLIGYGSIAREVATRAKALGMIIHAYDPYVDATNPIWQTAKNSTLEEILAISDVVSLHVPLTSSTKDMINAETLKFMKPTAVVINAARGGIIDEAALANALNTKIIAGAALDVFEEEPLSAAKAAVFKDCKNLILTPHIAGVTHEANRRVSFITVENIINHFK